MEIEAGYQITKNRKVFSLTLVFKFKIRKAVAFFKRNFRIILLFFFENQKEPAVADLQKFRFYYLKIL